MTEIDTSTEAVEKELERLAGMVEEAMEALRFYGNEDHYNGEYIPDECGCCGSWYEPKIHKDGEDSGDLARATLAKMEKERERCAKTSAAAIREGETP